MLACTIVGAQQVTISRDAKLLAEPNATAAAAGELKQGATAEVVGKQGAFVQLKSGATSGWTYSFNVNYGSGGAPAAAPTPKTRTTQPTAGIRGLEAEDLKNAQFDGKQLDSLDSFAGDAPAAKGKGKGK
jgi:hypothetical protein